MKVYLLKDESLATVFGFLAPQVLIPHREASVGDASGRQGLRKKFIFFIPSMTMDYQYQFAAAEWKCKINEFLLFSYSQEIAENKPLKKYTLGIHLKILKRFSSGPKTR